MHLSWEICLGKGCRSGRPRDYREGIRIAVGQTWKFGYMVFLTTYRQPNCGEDLKSSDCTTLLRLIICGGVDDGKSTLLARLLHESKMTGRRRFIAADTPDREQTDRRHRHRGVHCGSFHPYREAKEPGEKKRTKPYHIAREPRK